MTSDTTMILNLTFVGTLMIAAFLAALVLFAGCMALVVTGVGRLIYLGASRLIGAGRSLGGRVTARQSTAHDADVPAPAAVTSTAAHDGPGRVAAPSPGSASTASGTPTAHGKSGLIPSWRKTTIPAGDAAEKPEKTAAAAAVGPGGKGDDPAPAGTPGDARPVPSVTVTLSEPGTSLADEAPRAEQAGLRAAQGPEPEPVLDAGPVPAVVVTPASSQTGAPRSPKNPSPKNATPKSPGRSAPRPTGSARNVVPGILRPTQDPEEQHAKGA